MLICIQYVYVTRIKEKEAMNLSARQGGVGRRKRKMMKRCDYILISKLKSIIIKMIYHQMNR